MRERNDGIDALRIVCMIMIPLLHILGHGGLLYETQPFSPQYEAAWFLESAAFCAANCYGLISGYVGYGARFRYANILYLYLQVLFYTGSVTIICAFVHPEWIESRTILQAVLPFAYGAYWYFTAYFAMFFFIPFLNALLDRLDPPAPRTLAITIFILQSVLPTVFQTDMSGTGFGYNALWLALLYLLGGAMKKTGKQYPPRKTITIYILCVLLGWGIKLVWETVNQSLHGDPHVGFYWLQYTSPTVLLCSLCLLNLFAGLRITGIRRRLVRFFAPASFGVYLLHCEPLIWDHVLFLAFRPYLAFGPVQLVLAAVGTAFAVWLGCSLVDRFRLALFRLLRVKNACIRLENWAAARLDAISAKKEGKN